MKANKINKLDIQNPTFYWVLTLCVIFVFTYCFIALSNSTQSIDAELPEQMDTFVADQMSFKSFPMPPLPMPKIPATEELPIDEQVTNSNSTSQPNTSQQPDNTAHIDESDLLSIDMTIKMPSNGQHSRELGKFLYQCVNIGFGYTIDDKHNTSIQVIHDATYPQSSIYRRTQQALFPNERHWRQVYGRNERYLRIYPAWFDNILISYINQNLHGDTLQSLKATYSLRNNVLQLIDIRINGSPISQIWELANGYELGCR